MCICKVCTLQAPFRLSSGCLPHPGPGFLLAVRNHENTPKNLQHQLGNNSSAIPVARYPMCKCIPSHCKIDHKVFRRTIWLLSRAQSISHGLACSWSIFPCIDSLHTCRDPNSFHNTPQTLHSSKCCRKEGPTVSPS